MEPDIAARVEAEFAEADREAVLAELASITLDHVMARSAFNLRNARDAVLTLARGDVGKVRTYAEAARLDFRDVVMWAREDPAGG